MQYNLTRIDPDAPNEQYPIGERETVSDPLEDQVHKNIYMGKLEDVLPLVKENFGLVVLSDAEAAALPKDGDAAGMVLKPYEVDELRAAFERSMKGGDRKNLSDQDYLLYGEYEPFTVTLTHLLNQKSGIAWTTYSHTGVPVLTSAGGVGAERFGGFYDNTDIFARMAEIMGMKKSSAAVSPAVNTVVSPAVSLATAAN